MPELLSIRRRTKTILKTIDQWFLQEVARQPVTALVDVTVEDNITALTDSVDVLIFKGLFWWSTFIRVNKSKIHMNSATFVFFFTFYVDLIKKVE